MRTVLRAVLGLALLTAASPGIVTSPADASTAPPLIRTIAGVDGAGLATTVAQAPAALAVTGSSLYIATAYPTDESLIRRVDLATGQETVIAGTSFGLPAVRDGHPATSGSLLTHQLLAQPDGSVLFRDERTLSLLPPVRRIDPAGVVTTVAPAVGGTSFTTDSSGALLEVDPCQIRRVSPTGTTVVAGTGTCAPGSQELGDGSSALSDSFGGNLTAAADSSGGFFVADGNGFVYSVDPMGILHRVGGNTVLLSSSNPPPPAPLKCPAVPTVGAPLNATCLPFPVVVPDGAGHVLLSVSGFVGVTTTRIVDAAANGTIVAVYGADGVGTRGATGGALFIPAAPTLMGGPDGTIYLANVDSAGPPPSGFPELPWSVVHAIDTSGRVTRVAGIGDPYSAGDGGPAKAAQLDVDAIAVSPGGLLLRGVYGIRRIGPTGLIATVSVGPLTPVFETPQECCLIAADKRGAMYYTGGDQPGPLGVPQSIFRQASDGSVTRVVNDLQDAIVGLAADPAGDIFYSEYGLAPGGFTGDGTSRVVERSASGATRVLFQNTNPAVSQFQSLAYDVVSNSLYMAYSCYVARLRLGIPAATVVPVAGTPQPSSNPGSGCGFVGDGGPALAATVGVTGMAAAPDGALFLADGFDGVIRRVSPIGVITRVAGVPPYNWHWGDTLPATQAGLDQPWAIALDPNVGLYVTDGGMRIRLIRGLTG